jgi:hypothetical protein
MATDPTDKYNIKDILSNTEEQVGKLLTGGISENLNGRDILNINEIAAIDWGYKYSYMIRIEGFYDVSPVFRNDIIPATIVQEKFPSIKTDNIKLPMVGNFELPINRGLPTLQISMLDTVDCRIERLLRKWIRYINDGNRIQYLDNITKRIYVHKLDYNRGLIYTNLYYAYPDGDILVSMGSDNNLKELAVDFTVIDYKEGV